MELKKKILHFHFYWISIFFSAAEISRKENKRLLSSSSAILNQKQIKVSSDNVILYVNKSAGYEILPGFSGQVFDKRKNLVFLLTFFNASVSVLSDDRFLMETNYDFL